MLHSPYFQKYKSSYPSTALERSLDLQEVYASRMKVAVFLSSNTGSPYSPRVTSSTHISQNLGELQERSAA